MELEATIWIERDFFTFQDSLITSSLSPVKGACLGRRVLRGVDDAAEADGSSAVAAGSHEQEFFVLVETVGLREIPDRAARLIIRSASNNRRARMLIAEFIGPLRNVAFHVENPEGAATFSECINVRRRPHRPAVIGRR